MATKVRTSGRSVASVMAVTLLLGLLGVLPGGPAGAGPDPAPARDDAVAAGYDHTCGIRADDTATCWGWNEFGQAPGDLPGTWTRVDTGTFHSCGIRTDGTAACWGNDADGQAPEAIPGTWTDIDAGGFHTCGIRADGTAACWGWNGYGQAPGELPGEWSQVAAGAQHSCGIRSDGTATCWGRDSEGQAPEALSGSWTTVDTGGFHTCGVRADATAACWGWDDDGQAPGDLPGTWLHVDAGDAHTCGLRTDGTATCFGRDDDGRAPGELTGTWTAVDAGGHHSCGIRSDGTGACWGSARHGQLGPVVTSGPPPSGVVGVAYSHTFTASSSATFSVSGGALPAGLDLASDGTVSGTPSAAGAPDVTVTASNGVVSDSQTTSITIDPPPNSPPTADAGDDRTVNSGTTVTLDGTGSTDPDGDDLTYAWTQTAGPATTLTGADTTTPTFTAPTGPATLTFTLTVTDPHDATDTDTVTITVNGTPAADAGPDQSVRVGDTVTLDGSASSDPDGDDLDFAWTQTAGPTVDVDGADTVAPAFSAPPSPAGPTLPVVVAFDLTVTDPHGATSTDTVIVTSSPELTPNQEWVARVYATFLHRAPETGGFEYWSGRLDSGTPRLVLATQIGFGVEATSGPLLTTLYRDALGRAPWPGERAYWAGQLRDGMPLHHLIRHLVSSNEAHANAGGTDAAWLTRLYQSLLGRTPHAAEIDYWTGLLDDGAPRYIVAGTYQNTPEARAYTIARLAGEILGRDLTTEEHGTLDDLLRTTRDPRHVSVTLITWL